MYVQSLHLIQRLFVCLSIVLVGAGCGEFIPPEEIQVSVKLNDPEIRKLFDWQDKQEADSLFLYQDHPKATYRYLVAKAFGSIRKIRDITPLTKMLEDPVDSVRMAAAFALGQIGDSTAAPFLAAAFDTSAAYMNAKYAILEAVGKCAPASYLNYLASVENYSPDFPKPAEGLVLGIYRFGLRGITSPAATAKMVDMLSEPSYSKRLRLVAANYLARSAEGLDQLAPSRLLKLLQQEEDPSIRMALVLALGKNGSPELLEGLQAHWSKEKDYRVRCNLMRTLVFFDRPEAFQLAYLGLNDPNAAVSQRAAQFFVDKGTSRGAFQYWRWSRDSFPIATKVVLSKATMRHIPIQSDTSRRAYSYILRSQFLNETAPYAKAAWLSAVAEEVWNFRFIFRETFQHEHPAVRTAGMAALREIAQRSDFNRIFGVGRNSVSRELSIYFYQALKSEDAGLISEASIALRHPERDFATRLADSLPAMEKILNSLSLPEQLEPYLELKRTIHYFKGESTEVEPEFKYNHEIDWNRILIRIPRQATLNTTKGAIVLTLYPEQAPGTVVNFVNLAEQDFFNGKAFHRVVPNFVIQGGCPRGDGYGSLDYTIRSELAYLHFEKEGMLGMASAGNHTEGTQFFITHSPTLHLDGNYTLFGQVSQGMNVVHNMEIGDQIIDVSIQ